MDRRPQGAPIGRKRTASFENLEVTKWAFVGFGVGRLLGFRMIAEAETNPEAHPIIVFDGFCVLCSSSAEFVLKHDRGGHFRLAAMQNEVGHALYRQFGIDPTNPETLIVVSGTSALRGSDAVLAIGAGLGWPWRATGVLRLVPRPVRDAIYRWAARNRYRVFGRRDMCWVPTREQAARIL